MSDRKVGVGRKVLVSYEAEITDVAKDGSVIVRADQVAPGHFFIVYPGQFEVQDQPQLDPLGTVRYGPRGPYIKVVNGGSGVSGWRSIYHCDVRSDDQVAGDHVVRGVVTDFGKWDLNE